MNVWVEDKIRAGKGSWGCLHGAGGGGGERRDLNCLANVNY